MRLTIKNAERHFRATKRLLAALPVLEARGSGRRRKSLRQIAAELNAAGVPAPRGGSWASEQVRRALAQGDRAARLLTHE